MTKFCRAICGHCAACEAAQRELDAKDAAYAALSDEDAASIHRADPDDPRTFALDHKGRPCWLMPIRPDTISRA